LKKNKNLPPRIQTLCGFAASVWMLPSWPACRQAGQEGSFYYYFFTTTKLTQHSSTTSTLSTPSTPSTSLNYLTNVPI
jgi:hypothetical protein